jgi:hypothetical protein
MRPVATLLVAVLCAAPGGQSPEQSLDVTADARPVTAGDPITLTIRARLARGATIVDVVPRTRDTLPEDLRITSSDTLRRASDGLLTGRVHLVLFRPGAQRIPAFALAYRAPGSTRVDTLISPAIAVEVRSVRPPQATGLRDIKDIVRSPIVRWTRYAQAALAVGLAVVLGVLLARPHSPSRAEPEPAPLSAPPSGPYEVALARLAEVEHARLPEHGDVARHYGLVADVLRRYLEEAHGVPALERTTVELLRVLPAELRAAGAGAESGQLLDDADLVKFARLRPDASAARTFLDRTRALLARWNESRDTPTAKTAEPTREAVADALR